MATLYHFPNFHSLSSPKLSLSSHFLSPYSRANCRHNYRYSTIFASSVKKPPRASRKLKSDEELRDDIKDYLSSAGLPENHVPTMKELSVYGRQDLAHIVRRRGYKFIRQLLETSSTENSFESNGEATTSRDNYISTRQHTSTSSGDSDDEKVEDQADVKRLRFLLHQKELELTQLKEQIEKEKLALSHLHSEAEEEISQADELVSEKETELHAAEEALSGLKKVEIKYAGEGETVELAGSFNGWLHKIPMEPHLSSIIFDSTESKKTRDWRAVLWLYPGVYEIKFVVDGDWRIDMEKESINRNGVPNNILRVDRSDGVDEC